MQQESILLKLARKSVLKSGVDKIDLDKCKQEQIKNAPADLSKLGDVVKNEVVKKTVYQ